MKTLIRKLILVTILLVSVTSNAQEKLDLKVLFVGYQPEKPFPKRAGNFSIAYLSKDRIEEEYNTRYPAFINYLKNTFSNVTGVDVREYTENMSADYDVTVFDQVPNPISEGGEIKNAEGQRIGYTPRKYISENFDHAAVFIGHTATVMTSPVGSKLDWYCLCLDADAHSMRTEHPVFKGPLKVSLSMETKPTPSGIFHYGSGQNAPKNLQMWRVQKEGYMEGKGFRIGLVSSSDGFLDSPEAEIISGGVCTKDINAIAIGRHGNFFLWGFSAAPNYMTDEGKKVFANAVYYMKSFKGKKIIAKKTERLIFTRDYIKEIKFGLTQEGYQSYLELIRSFYDKNEKKRTDAIAKKESGKKLSEEEERLATRPKRPRKADMLWDDYTKRYMGKFRDQFGTNVKAYIKYLDDNIEFIGFDKEKGYYGLSVDEDVKQLGVSNRKLELLEKCIGLLKSGDKVKLATRILKRYTVEDFRTATEWSSWFNTNKNKLFFTEAGGFKWLVNTL